MRTVQARVQACRVIEKMERQAEYSKKLGLVNRSKFSGTQKQKTIKREDHKND